MFFQTASKKLNATITFHSRGAYVFAKFGDSEYRQICEGGRTNGVTVMCAEGNEQDFRRACQRWKAAYIRRVTAAMDYCD